MANTSPSATLFTLTLLFIAFSTQVRSHNITDILASDPDFSQFNTYLSQTKLADDINTRITITVLAIPNSDMSSLSSAKLSGIKNILSLHILLDYYDHDKLTKIPHGTVSVTSLYQTTGQADNNVGRVNITDSKDGKIKFGSAQTGSNSTSYYLKEVKTIAYNISVIAISQPIIVQSLLNAPAVTDVNVTALLEKAGCKTFASLITASGVLKVYQSQLDKGITIFAPNDEAFKAKGVPDLSKLTNAELVSLLQYHALNSYASVGTLKTAKGPLSTLAAGAGNYSLTVSSAGDSVTLHTGVDSSRLASTVLDATPAAIYTVDSVLLPAELFSVSPAPAPAPESESPSPAPSPKAESPAPVASPAASPPAPPAGTPAESPDADGPAKAADENSKKNAGARKSASVIFAVGVSVACGVILLVI